MYLLYTSKEVLILRINFVIVIVIVIYQFDVININHFIYTLNNWYIMAYTHIRVELYSG